MLKFLRKYQTILLVVFGIVLMVSFLVPQLLTQALPAMSNPTLGKVDGEALRERDLLEVRTRLQLIDGLVPALPLNPGLPELHWLLLVREAEGAGLVGGPEDGRAFFERLISEQFEQQLVNARQQRAQQIMREMGASATNEALVARLNELEGQDRATFQQRFDSELETVIRQRTGVGNRADAMAAATQEFYAAMAEHAGVRRLVNMWQLAGARFSGPELTQVTRERLDSALVDALVLDATPMEAGLAAPTEEELAAHFAAYRASRPDTTEAAQGGNEYRFGYRQPPRVKLEYIVLDTVALRGLFTPRLIDTQDYYQRNHPTMFPGTFEQERQRVEGRLRDQRVGELVSSAERVLHNQMQAVRAARELKEDRGFLTLPADWSSTRPTMQTLVERVLETWKADLGVELAADAVASVVRVVRADAAWMTARELSAGSLRSYEDLVSVRRADELASTISMDGLLKVHGAIGLARLRDAADPTALASDAALAAAFAATPDLKPSEEQLGRLAVLLRSDALRSVAEEIEARTVLGGLSLRVGNQQLPVAVLPLIVRESGPPVAQRPPQLQSVPPMQVGWPLVDLPISDAEGRRYTLLVTDARPESAPDSIEEVRDEVERDWRRLRAYEALLALRAELEGVQATDGLSGVQRAYTARAGALVPPTASNGLSVSRARGFSAPGGGFGGFDPRLQDAALFDAVLDAIESGAATLVHPLPGSRVLACFNLRQVTPATAQDYRLGGELLAFNEYALGQQEQLNTALVRAFAVGGFSFEQLRRRHGLELKAEKDAGATAPGTPAAG